MNHCIIGGVDNGDSGEDGRDEQRGAWAAAVPAAAVLAAARGTPPPLASWGSAVPYPPSFMASWEPSPVEMGSMGRRKRGSGGCKFVGGGVPHELGFIPLYSFSDFHLTILGRTRSGLTQPSGLGIWRILYPERLPWNSLQLCSWRVFRLTPSSTCNVTIFEKSSDTDFRKVPIWLQQGSHLYSW
jgi:hypothetical protein